MSAHTLPWLWDPSDDKRGHSSLPLLPLNFTLLPYGSLLSPVDTDSSGVTYQSLDQFFFFFISHKKYINTILFEKI